MNINYKNCEDILYRYKYPLHSKEELFKIIKTIENLAQLICDFEKRKLKKNKRKEKYENNKTKK